MNFRITGLVAATHTPFDRDGHLDLDRVEKQAEHLIRTGVQAAFISGSTGECHSLALTERLALAERWMAVVRGTDLKVVVHVGSNCLADSRELAAHAARIGAAAVSALSPSYFKPRTTDDLIACCAHVASAAPELPFYFYDIPSLTGVSLPAAEVLERGAERIPNLAGAKFTNADLMGFQLCLNAGGGRFDIPWGTDESLLAAVALGAKGAVGSTYNFAAPIYHRVLEAAARGDFATAREYQFRSVRLVQTLVGYGFMPAAKAVMAMVGVPVGPTRLPLPPLTDEQYRRLEADLTHLGFFDWLRD